MEAASVSQTRTAAATRTREKARKRPDWMGKALLIVAIIAIIVFCLFPFYWLVNVSLKTGPDLSTSALLPPNPTLENFKSIFEDSNFTTALKNSAIVALVTTALALIVGSFCAYALARLKIRFKFFILAIILTITTFPQITIAAPIFKLWRDVGLYNTIPGLVILHFVNVTGVNPRWLRTGKGDRYGDRRLGFDG